MLSHYPDILGNHTDALTINLENAEGRGVSGWGWQDNAYFAYDTGIVRFEKDAQHIIRVQRREDGVAIERICLVPVTREKTLPNDSYSDNPSGSLISMYTKANSHSNEIITIKAEVISDSNIFGSWQKIQDPTADSNLVLKDIPDSGTKTEFALLDPENYFETAFYAKGGIEYHVWVKMKAENDSISSDSIYLQFNDSINQQGEPVYRIGQYGQRNRLKEIDLILAGHTHGGQVRLPVIGSFNIVPSHNIKYDMGLFNKQGTTMYVNRGIGTTILPIRFFCSPEITIFRFTEKHKDSIHGDVKTNEM
jgi:hypothetical protein